MKKIPTLFERVFENHRVIDVLPNITKGFEWVLKGEGVATVKLDGACCAIINGELYKRYDAKAGKKAPDGAIPCCDPDPITGHWPHWVKCDRENPNDKWFWSAYDYFLRWQPSSINDGTYEAIGRHFNGNPYGLDYDIILPHGRQLIGNLERSFDGIKKFLKYNYVEGIVFWKDNEPQCKIKRSDFGFEWNNKKRV